MTPDERRRLLAESGLTTDDFAAPVAAWRFDDHMPNYLAGTGGQHWTLLLAEDCETVMLIPNGPEFVAPTKVELRGREVVPVLVAR